MLRTLAGVTGVLAALAVLVGGAGLAALATVLRPLARRVAVIVLAAAIGLATAGATVAASARQSVDDAFAAMPGDLVVQSAAPIDPATLDAIRAIRSVDLAASGATAAATVEGARTTVASWDDNGAANLLLARHATSGTIETLAAGQLLMSSRTAERFGARVGDRVTVAFPHGEPRDLRLVGLYGGTPADPGIVLPWSDWSAMSGPGATAMLVKLAPGTSVTDVAAQVDDALAGRRGVSVRTNDQTAAALDATLDRLVAVLWALLAVAMVLGTLAMARSPRTPTPTDGARESATRAVFLSAAGVAGGVVLGSIVTWALGDRGVTDLTVPWAQLAACIIAAALLGAVTAIRPPARGMVLATTPDDSRARGANSQP
jgi:putative ABC transport system permease protein